jgi:hypothetical protein
LKINIDHYQAVKEHLLSFGYDRLKQTGDPGARKKAHNQWFETQDSINYWEDFYKPKLIYPDIMRMPGQESLLKEYPYFYFDDENIFAEATNFIMTGDNIDLIYLFLTSELGFFAFSKFYTGPQFDATGFRYKKAYLDETFIPMPNDQEAIALRNILQNKMNYPDIYAEINAIWAKIVGLEEKEVAFVNSYKKSLLSNAI